jgi:hypothetical protein
MLDDIAQNIKDGNPEYFKGFPKNSTIRFLPIDINYYDFISPHMLNKQDKSFKCILCEMENNKMSELIINHAISANLAYKSDDGTIVSNFEDGADISSELTEFANNIIKDCLTILADVGSFEGGSVSAFNAIAEKYKIQADYYEYAEINS